MRAKWSVCYGVDWRSKRKRGFAQSLCTQYTVPVQRRNHTSMSVEASFTFTFMRLWPGSIRREWPGSGAVRALDKK